MGRVSSLLTGRFMRLARRSADTWQGGLVKMPLWVGEREETPHRPWGAVWLSLETDLINVKLAEGVADWRVALDALTELGLRFAGTRPASLEVTDRTLADEIVHALGDRELAVKVSADIARGHAVGWRPLALSPRVDAMCLERLSILSSVVRLTQREPHQ